MPAAKKKNTQASSPKKQITIPLPGKVTQTQVIYTLLLIAVFLVGYLLATVRLLNSPSSNSQQASPTSQAGNGQTPSYTNDDIKVWAKNVGLNTNKFNTCFDKLAYQDKIDKDTKDGQTAGVSGTPSFFVNGHLVVGALPADVFSKLINFELNNGDWSNLTELSSDTITASFVDGNEQNGEFGKEVVNVDKGNLPVLGNENAPVTIIEFSDLECPFCKKFFSEAFPTIKKDFIDTGKVKMYFRHYPLPFHPMAKPFANAVECANEQGKFWQMHDYIFSK